MNILLVSSYLPYPLHSGGHVRLYNLIKELSKQHTITLICEKRPHQSSSDVKELEKICKKVITVNREKQWSVRNVLKSGMSSHSFLTTGHALPSMQEKIIDVMKQDQFDLIHCETFYVMQNIPETNIPIVLVEHNIEYLVYQKFVDRTPIVMKPLLLLDIAKMKREEELCWKRATKVVAVSEEDKKVIAAQGITATVVANGVDLTTFTIKKSQPKEKKVLFIGDFKWLQNRDAVQFIIQDIWPKVREEVNLSTPFKEKDFGVKFWIVGRSIPDSIKALSDDPTIFFDEKSSSRPTPELFQEATVLLAPIRVGGGTSYKILESMACGTPVVTMPLSANAIHATDGDQLLVGKNASELADRTEMLLHDDNLYSHIAKKGRKLIEAKYTWKEIAKELEEVYIEVMK